MRIEKDEKGKLHYYDKNGKEIHEGELVEYENGRVEKVYLTEGDYLGIDATNPAWITSGRAEPCEYGIYPFNGRDEAPVIVNR